jgi:hypothetical protein
MNRPRAPNIRFFVKLINSPLGKLFMSPQYPVLEEIQRSGHGCVDQIEIDLRHEKLNPAEWQCEPFGMPPGTMDLLYVISPEKMERDPEEPFIWFPWFGDFDMSALKRKAKTKFASKPKSPRARGKNAIRTNPELDEYVRINTPEHIAAAGDRICIDEVEIVNVVDHRFEHPHNAEIRYAQLRVERANGDVHKLPTPLRFTGVQKIICDGNQGGVPYLIAMHICDHFALENLYDNDTIREDGSYAYRALLEARQLLAKLLPMVKKIARKGDILSESYWANISNLVVVSDAAVLGYLWGKAEAEINIKPRLESQLRKSSLGGKNSAKKRWEDAQRSKLAVRELAKTIWEKNRTKSQHDIATTIHARWSEVAGSGHEAPEVLTVKKYLKGMISPAKVAKRATRKKP